VQEVEGRRSEAEGGEDHPGGMIQSRDKLIMEMVEEYGLNHMGENDDDEDEDDDDEGNVVAPLHLRLLSCLRRSSKKKPPWRWFPNKRPLVAHEVILAVVEPKLPQPHLFNMIMRNYEESPPRMENGP
jgi:hypothetical protein